MSATKRKKRKSRIEERPSEPVPTTKALPGKYDYLNEVAYVITDKKYGKFEVRKTANAWWKDKGKVDDLIKAGKIGAKGSTACYYVGITVDQLNDFFEVHPHFAEFFEILKEHPKLTALNTIVNNLGDPAMARWFAERKMKEEFSSRVEHTGADGADIFSALYARVRLMTDAELEAEIKKMRMAEKCPKAANKK